MSAKDTNRATHTPGPWQWYWRVGDDLRADCGVFYEKREGHAYSVCRAPQYQSQAQWEADARLIAAAPDLLAALETVKRVLQGEQAMDIMLGVKGPCLGDVIRDAIEKARG